MSNARYKKSLDQEADEVISVLSNVSINNAQSLMAEGSDLRQVVLNMKNNLIEHEKSNLLARLEDAEKQAEATLRLSVFEFEWGIFGNAWSPDTGYFNHLVRVRNFLDKPEQNQSKGTAKHFSPNEERHWVHDRLYSFEESLSKNLIKYTDELKFLSSDHYKFNQYFRNHKVSMKRLCQLIYWLVDNDISAFPVDFMERLNWLAGKCQVHRQSQVANTQ